MSELTIKLPESLLVSAHHAAEGSQKSLQSLVLEMLQERVQQQNGTTQVKVQKATPAEAQKATKTSSSQTIKKPNGWDGKRMKQDWAWVDTHYNTLADKYAGQWIIVYDQKVRGAHRDMGIAQDQATADIGNIHKAGAIELYVERDRFFPL
ncbi:MAG: hypothetical protein ACPGWR_20720 [Ardenticatenaceae bacterium]